MDLKTVLEREHSKANTVLIQKEIGANQEYFDKLIWLFLNEDHFYAQRAAWVVRHCYDVYPFLIQKHIRSIIEHLKKENLHDAVIRNSLAILCQYPDLTESDYEDLLNLCFNYLESSEYPVAFQALSLEIILHSTKYYPELREELRLIIEDKIPYATSGFVSKGRRILKALQKGKHQL